MSLSLRSFSDRDILARIQDLTRRERSVTLDVLLHLNEIARRNLHLKLGYSSLFAYCTEGLRYSSSAADRRIQSARCLARFPEVLNLLASNEVNLTTVALVSRTLDARNKNDILARIRGRSQNEVRAIVAEYEPRGTLPRDRVSLIVFKTPAPASAGSVPAVRTPDRGACEESNYSRCGSAADPPVEGPLDPVGMGGAACNHEEARSAVSVARNTTAEARTERGFFIQFAANPSFMAKLERLRALASHRLPANASLEQVFEMALSYFIEREDPCLRRERRGNGKRDSAETAPQPQRLCPADGEPEAPRPGDGAHNVRARSQPRYIPARVREEVFTRDKGRCTFVGANGRRCESTHVLQIDHVRPVARGGESTPANLRLLCAYHNRLEAERLMGIATSDRAIARRSSLHPRPPTSA